MIAVGSSHRMAAIGCVLYIFVRDQTLPVANLVQPIFSKARCGVSSTRRKVVLLCACDWCNVGHLPIGRVVIKLVVHDTSHATGDSLHGGVASVDMSGVGGNANILDLKNDQKVSYRDAREPFDIVFFMVGGEIENCDYGSAGWMLPTKE